MQEGTAGKDSTGEIDMTLILGCALRRAHSPGSGLGEIKDEEIGENRLEDKARLLLTALSKAPSFASVTCQSMR